MSEHPEHIRDGQFQQDTAVVESSELVELPRRISFGVPMAEAKTERHEPDALRDLALVLIWALPV